MKRALVTLTTISALVIPLGAQEPVDLVMIERIKAEGLERSEVMEHFNYLTNVIGPRLSATPAYKRAADWGVMKFEEWGLENAHLESWDFGRGWTLEGLTLEMRSPRYFPLFGYPEAWTPSTDGIVEGPPVYIGDWTTDDLRTRGSELRGKAVLIAQPQEGFIEEDRLQPAD